jgi:hypothetical protein
MPASRIPDEHHVLRYAPKKLTFTTDDGDVCLLPQAFELRDDEATLSVTWVEHFKGDLDAQMDAAVEQFCQSLTVKNSAAFGVGAVHNIKEMGRLQVPAHQLRILHEPEHDNLGHAAIHRYPRNHPDLQAALASTAFATAYLRSEFPRCSVERAD